MVHWRLSKKYTLLLMAAVAVLLLILALSAQMLVELGFIPPILWPVTLQSVRLIAPLALLSVVGRSYFKLYRTVHGNRGTQTADESERQGSMGIRRWLQFLIIGLMLTGAAVLIFMQSLEMEENRRVDQHREAILRTYVDDVSRLLVEQGLRTSPYNAEVRTIASAQTIATLPRLDPERKGSVLRFLYESQLLDSDDRVIRLSNADPSDVDARLASFRRIDLRQTNLHQANLRQADLRRADLSQADLTGAFLSFSNLANVNLWGATLTQTDLRQVNLENAYLKVANLRYADLSNANLTNANLEQADLTGAIVTNEQLARCKSLIGAILPDGSTHQ